MPGTLTYQMLTSNFFLARVSLRYVCQIVLLSSLAFSTSQIIRAQTEPGIEDDSADPMRLFELGQNAHAHAAFERAVSYYEEAIKIRPDFPEAQFQLGNALVSLERFDQAETAYRKAIALRASWAPPQSALGLLLLRLNRPADAEAALRLALKIDPQDQTALRALAGLRLQAGDAKEALSLATRATSSKDASVRIWIIRAMAERAIGDKVNAAASLDHILQLDPHNQSALLERAEMRIENNNPGDAITDLRSVETLGAVDKYLASRLAQDYEHAGKPDDAHRIASTFQLMTNRLGDSSDQTKAVIGSTEEIDTANSDDPVKARKALKTLLEKNPRNAMLLARLGNSYRTEDPTVSLEFYRRAWEIEPKNVEYATGYAAALVQARNFSDAIRILQGVIAIAPENYTAHTNLATALYKQKLYSDAIAEYEWIIQRKPELGIVYYFIATAHDYLGEYPEALGAYEAFLTHAELPTNQLEVEKVKLRLPTLRHQIELGQGAKRKNK